MEAIQPQLSLLNWLNGKSKMLESMTWILASVDQLIVFNLRPYKTTKDLWEYLKKVYNQDNTARRFQLEYDIANYSQGNLSIQYYFFGFQSFWAEFVDIVYAKVPTESLSVVQEVHEQSKRDQFFMKLRPKFEAIHSNMMNRAPSPSLDVRFGELLCEEQRLATQTTLQQNNILDNAAHRRGKVRNMQQVQCYSYKEYGHIAARCAKKSCNYCKKPEHTIKDCPTRPQNRQANVNQAVVGPVAIDKSALTPKMVQQMIISAISALGLQGKGDLPSSFWLVDSDASYD